VSTYLSIHGGTNNYLSSFNISIIIIFHFLLYVVKVLSSLIDHEWRPIRIEFLTLQGKPNAHAGERSHPRNISPFTPGRGSGHPPRLEEPHATAQVRDVATLCTHMCAAWELCSKGVEICPLAGLIRYLSLPITIFLGMWLVRSNA